MNGRQARIEKVEGGYIVAHYAESGIFEHRAVYTDVLDALVGLCAILEPLAGIEKVDLATAVTNALEDQ